MWVYVCRLCHRQFTDIVELLAHMELEHISDARVREVVRTWRDVWAAGYRLSRKERYDDLKEAGLAERRWVRGGAPL
jgi:hypothetical protein